MAGYGVAWTLKLMTFRGLVFGASHYSATLTGRTEDVIVGYVMTETDAAALSEGGYTYRPGDWTERFFTREDAVAGALVAWRSLAGERDVLVREYDDDVLAGPQDLIDARTDDDWWTWLDRFQPHLHDTVFGHNAPPSVRRQLEVIVRRTADGWEVIHDRSSAKC